MEEFDTRRVVEDSAWFTCFVVVASGRLKDFWAKASKWKMLIHERD